ncbi:histidine--tRNA ligase [Helicobacter kayseriensis]|uniref:histidine--tRNA ligase n=1 Tax=Helicobacter kayseriensis TaxID=2905877 RepID=UPI001E3B57C1|nr:histidine--tRNA ligase [Helicobacter kayseriensis]MCE3046854.1 histidine--tRNA ligase [Helicobacter kayseriensis]MCE3047844.1 histidine--tRNA ligase [Helicobacter kayseriensis]
MIQARTLSGFKDRLPQEAIAKSELLRKIVTVFEGFGFVPIETPHLEYADVLIKQGSDEIQKELYAFKDHGGRDVALRFDLTVPLARFVSQHRHTLPMPFKRYAIGNVFRGERAQRGRYREFTQCDFDFIGSKSIASDSEILQMIASIMQALEVGRFQISINHRGILNGICEFLGIKEINGALRIIDKLDKIGKDGVEKELIETLGFSQDCAKELLKLVGIRQNGGVDEFFQSIAFLKEYNTTLLGAISELEELAGILKALDLPKDSWVFNFSIARGLGYYTGIIYETILMDLPNLGSVCSGGRYDHLTKTFSKEDLSGVGASVGLDRLLAGLEELGKMQAKKTKAKILALAMQKEQMPFVQAFAQQLRKEGVGCEVYPDCIKLGKIFSYADSKGFEYVVIVGEDEAREQKVSLKNMQSGEQYSQLGLQEVLEYCKE